MAERRTMTRKRLRKTDDVSANNDPFYVGIEARKPKDEYIDCKCCNNIDQHNRCRQQELYLEKKICTHHWGKITNTGILEMITVNLWLCSKLMSNRNETQEDYFQCLAE